jgi:Pyruvate/2-oxoacid:ferredoxin oxidoreductase delta subunit
VRKKKANRHRAKTKHTNKSQKEGTWKVFYRKKREKKTINCHHKTTYVTNKKLVTGCIVHDKRE